MKITILTFGTRGDVQPLIALGIGLQRAGYDIDLVASPSFATLVRSHGLNYSSLRDESGFPPNEELLWKKIDEGQNPLRISQEFFQEQRRIEERAREDSWAACQGTEAIIDSTPGWGYHIAESLKVPYYYAPLCPYTPTKAFPNVVMTGGLRLGGLYNLWTHKVAEQLAWQPMRKSLNRWRTEMLGLPPVPFFGPYRRQREQQSPILYGYSPVVLPKPSDWPSYVHVTGYWFLDPLPQWHPPARLVQFLQAGPPPVYIGFGSMGMYRAEAIMRLAADALQQTGQRGLVLNDPRLVSAPSDDILVINDVPHAWLFPQVAAVVHHGGAGTTGAAMRAGVPSVTVPLYQNDQPFWGRRIAELGVGPLPISRSRLSAETLGAAIRTVVSDPGIQARAAALGERIRAEDGVARAIEAFHADLPRSANSLATVSVS